MSATIQDMPPVIDLITGRWRSQIVHAGTALGVFDALTETDDLAIHVLAARLGADPEKLYRLTRALASLGLLAEGQDRSFRCTPMGCTLKAGNPLSLRSMVLLEEGPVHYAAWKHLPDIVRTGVADGFHREFASPYWAYLQRDATYARDFSAAMTSYSAIDAPAVAASSRDDDFRDALFCDVGGGHGALLAALLAEHPTTRGIVFDLPEVIWSRPDASSFSPGVIARMEFVEGDMFQAIPAGDVYLLKHVLHDWPDAACLSILSNIRAAAKTGSRLLICEFIPAGPDESHFGKIIDIHMMVVQDGRQRTREELEKLLHAKAWHVQSERRIAGTPLTILEAIAAD